MKLIVGLGNPGVKYRNNRHNVGFMFVDFLASKSPAPLDFKKDKYLLAEVAQLSDEIMLVKPQTYMNKSGDAVAACIKRYGINDIPRQLIVVHDDLDIPLGKFKIQSQGPKLHNGLISIQNKLQTVDFIRVRIGVDARLPDRPVQGEEYVLQDFLAEQQSRCTSLFSEIVMRFEVEKCPIV